MAGRWLMLGCTLLAATVPATAGRPAAQPSAAGMPPIAIDLGTLGGEFCLAQAFGKPSQVVGFNATSAGAQHTERRTGERPPPGLPGRRPARGFAAV